MEEDEKAGRLREMEEVQEERQCSALQRNLEPVISNVFLKENGSHTSTRSWNSQLFSTFLARSASMSP